MFLHVSEPAPGQAYGRDAAVLALRTGHADARLDEAEAHKVRAREPAGQTSHSLTGTTPHPLLPQAAGNAALQADPGRALEQYTRALSLLAWFGAHPLSTLSF